MMRLKHNLNRFNKETVGDIGKSYSLAKETYHEALFDDQANHGNFSFQEAEKKAAEAYETQGKMYHSFLRHRSKITWLRKCDDNNAYFYAFLKKRKINNRIVSFVNKEGKQMDCFPEVVDHFFKAFKRFMGSLSIAQSLLNRECMDRGRKLSLDQQVGLLKPFTRKEIKKAFFSILNTKSPGPDGYGSGFYRELWPEIGGEICTDVLQFFKNGKSPAGLHETKILLVPKIDCPSRVIDYRPIA
ncbi:hypothetical protein CsatB_014279 [Cannabis sativa]|uniref:uncharacterized protein LOC115695164 n=1 Tax=Cannabis sativa TaxID=3483 RepID=UPI0011E060C6|nr:uncharacterized protein LOC115695164 [Cannabis sativa]